jgi:hypothetical protein
VVTSSYTHGLGVEGWTIALIASPNELQNSRT